MPNLIRELTPEYCNEMLVGAMFMKDGEPYQFRGADAENSAVRRFSTTPDKVTTKNLSIPNDFFTGWSAFEFPTLGYRMAGGGQLLAYVSRNNSVRRGLIPDDVKMEVHDVSFSCRDTFGFNVDHYTRGNGTVPLVMCPTYLAFADGLAKVMKGEIPAFALSPDFAVAPSARTEFLEILYRQRMIGTINENGKVDITAKNMLPSWRMTAKEDT